MHTLKEHNEKMKQYKSCFCANLVTSKLPAVEAEPEDLNKAENRIIEVTLGKLTLYLKQLLNQSNLM